jgi:hypothetical protein
MTVIFARFANEKMGGLVPIKTSRGFDKPESFISKLRKHNGPITALNRVIENSIEPCVPVILSELEAIAQKVRPFVRQGVRLPNLHGMTKPAPHCREQEHEML